MSRWNDLAEWMYGDVRTDRGFWYSHPLYEIRDLDDQQLFWVPPTADGLSIGHWIFITVGHCAIHIGKIQLLRNMLLNKRDNPC